MEFYGHETTRTAAQLVRNLSLDIKTEGDLETVELPNLIAHPHMIDAYLRLPIDGNRRNYKCLDCGTGYNEIPQGCEQCPAVFHPF